jgi:hypothetical protein
MTDISEYAPKTIQSSDLSVLGGARLIEYGEMVAVHIESVGENLLQMAQDQHEECAKLAADVRLMCQLQARRSLEIAERSRKAAVSIRDVRQEFTRPLSEDTVDAPA